MSHDLLVQMAYRFCNIMRLLLRCNGFNNSFAVNFHSFCLSFFCFPFILFLFPFFLVGLEYCTLKSLEHFSFNSVRWEGHVILGQVQGEG